MNFFCVFQINFFEFLAEISSLSKENLNFLGKNYGSSSFSDFDWKILSVKSLGRASNHHFAWPGEHVEEKFCFRATFIYHTFRTSSEFSSVFCQKNSPRCQNCILLVQRVVFGGKKCLFFSIKTMVFIFSGLRESDFPAFGLKLSEKGCQKCILPVNNNFLRTSREKTWFSIFSFGFRVKRIRTFFAKSSARTSNFQFRFPDDHLMLNMFFFKIVISIFPSDFEREVFRL